MDEPVVTAAPPPARLKNLAQQEVDFTSEGSPPPGKVGPVESLPSVDMASDHVRSKPIVPVTVQEAEQRDGAPSLRSAGHGAKRHGSPIGKMATRQR
jgi:hypothetical protein